MYALTKDNTSNGGSLQEMFHISANPTYKSNKEQIQNLKSFTRIALFSTAWMQRGDKNRTHKQVDILSTILQYTI